MSLTSLLFLLYTRHVPASELLYWLSLSRTVFLQDTHMAGSFISLKPLHKCQLPKIYPDHPWKNRSSLIPPCFPSLFPLIFFSIALFNLTYCIIFLFYLVSVSHEGRILFCFSFCFVCWVYCSQHLAQCLAHGSCSVHSCSVNKWIKSMREKLFHAYLSKFHWFFLHSLLRSHIVLWHYPLT